jgi:hypothetical protein
MFRGCAAEAANRNLAEVDGGVDPEGVIAKETPEAFGIPEIHAEN